MPDGEILADSKKKEYEFDYQYRLPKGITIYSVLALDEVGNKSKQRRRPFEFLKSLTQTHLHRFLIILISIKFRFLKGF